MGIDKLDRFATNAGVRTAPTPGMNATGYVAGEQVAAVNINYLWGEDIDKINELIEMAPSGFEEDLGTAAAISQYYPNGGDEAWSSPMDDQNIITSASTKAYVGLNAYINSDGERKIIALDGGTTTPRQFDVYDAATMTSESNSGDLSGDLPSGSGEVWIATCCCTDGTSMYACFYDSNAVGVETHRIQCWDIDGWNVKSGWAATGYAISGTGLGVSALDYGDICIADGTYVATTSPWVTIVNSLSDAISLFAMAGGGATGSNAGAGSASAGSAHRLTSDGTNIYFTTYTNAKVHKAAIANLEAVPADYPYNGANSCMDILSIGKMIVTTSTHADTLVFSNDVEEELCTAATGDTRKINTSGVMEFDGLNLWVRGSVLINAVGQQAVFKVAINNASYQATGVPGTSPAAEDLVKEAFIFDPDNYTIAWSEESPMCFDGRDIYLVAERRAGQTLSGYIYRIPKAILR